MKPDHVFFFQEPLFGVVVAASIGFDQVKVGQKVQELSELGSKQRARGPSGGLGKSSFGVDGRLWK